MQFELLLRIKRQGLLLVSPIQKGVFEVGIG